MIVERATLASPIGPLVVMAAGGSLVGLEMEDHAHRVGTLERRLEAAFGPLETRASRDPAGVATALDAYFGGDLGALARVPVRTVGTPFEERVWAELRRIPAGETRTYAGLAAAIGTPGASRAVGSANGRNLIALVIPCHRVIATGGGLGGYGGGLARKRWLLAHEGALRAAEAGLELDLAGAGR